MKDGTKQKSIGASSSIVLSAFCSASNNRLVFRRHRLMIGTLAVVAIVLCFLANLSCQFVQVDLLTGDWDVPDTEKYRSFGLGLWKRETGDDSKTDECVLWTPTQ